MFAPGTNMKLWHMQVYYPERNHSSYPFVLKKIVIYMARTISLVIHYHKHIQKHILQKSILLSDNFLSHMLIKRPLMNNVQNLSWLLYHNNRKGLTSNDLFISNDTTYFFNLLQRFVIYQPSWGCSCWHIWTNVHP